jgi:hypothetical protein
VTAEYELRRITGFDVRMATLYVNPLTGHVTVRGLANNPPTYPVPDFIVLRSFLADVEVYPWFSSHRIVVDRADLDIERVVFVRRRDGKSNVSELMAAFSGPPDAKPTQYLIKHLRLRVGDLVVATYVKGVKDEKVYHLELDQSYENVTDWRQLLVPSFLKKLSLFSLRDDLASLLPSGLTKTLRSAIADLAAHAKSTEKKTEKYLKDSEKKAETFINGLIHRKPPQ